MASTSGSVLCSCISRSVRPSTSSSARLRRAIHTRPNLPYDIRNGLEPFLSAKALRGTAVEWHQGCLDRLNDLTRGTPYENQSVTSTVIGSAKQRTDALIFGHASEALNNGFFLSSLKSSSSSSFDTQGQPNHMPVELAEAISNSFGSPTSFINYFSSYANGLFGTGYVWLVMDSVDNLAVLSTYGSGTVLVQGNQVRAPELEPFVAAEEGQGNVAGEADPAVQAAQEAIGHETERQPTREYENEASSSNPSSPSPFAQPQSQQTRSYHSSSSLSMPSASKPLSINFPAYGGGSTTKKPSAPAAGPKEQAAFQGFFEGVGSSSYASASPRRSEGRRFLHIHPLMCLSLHPHVYIPDYGIWGKERYIENFWKNVDWERVAERYNAVKAAYGGSSKGSAVGGRHRYEGRPASDAFAEFGRI